MLEVLDIRGWDDSVPLGVIFRIKVICRLVIVFRGFRIGQIDFIEVTFDWLDARNLPLPMISL